MTTELSFLIDLILNHKLQKVSKDAIAARIKEVECSGNLPRISAAPLPRPAVVDGALQSASTIAAMARHQEGAPPAPVSIIAQTPIAQAAMASRQQAINSAITGKNEKGQTSPRKW